ncbi:DUF4041 domain-containing protein [Jeotgalibaca sp. MA1X17-3]|uniref:DUF4041 domain-containing protein n=1 Tax=Jeotgalibaca sp. MA1X17-3 TaxID=2908211 RepID=UPI001F3953C1|nr:DUF4041 domain-containing protein [Jeotgalibaca sp. MA1X17-3]UJF16671.1 DUF4041 domain-containing protein [Jeotgalibaca sp. MA1X17-3]
MDGIKENNEIVSGVLNIGKPKDEQLEAKLIVLQNKVAEKQKILRELENAIINTQEDINIQDYGFYERRYKFSDATKYKEKLDNIRAKEKEMVKNKTAGHIVTSMTLNDSAAQGKTMQNQLIQAMIRGFNGEADALLVKITVSNVVSKVVALERSFDQLNRLYKRNSIVITPGYLYLKKQELYLAAEYELQKQEEKELLREQREKEREDKKLQAEIKAKRKQLDKDRTHYSNMVAKVKELLESADNSEIKKLKLQLQEYKNKLEELDEIEEDIDYREGHASAGYIYVISNIGSFGEDIYKIGVTRRLEPLERIRELSSASVPFQFDVHALMFSEQAFALETEIHNALSKYKVNQVNSRKEYFRVSFSNIKKILDNHKELIVELTEFPEAFEYRQTQKLLKNLT